MNYIELINLAWGMREQGILSLHEHDLFNYLVHSCNKLGWKNPFNHKTEVICSVLGINRNVLAVRRNRLKQMGLIDYKEGITKFRPAEYEIKCIMKDTQPVAQPIAETSKTAKRKEVAFTPPSVEEIVKYCTERDKGVDAQRFFDFYTAKDWMIGRNKMKDWRAAVRTWENTGLYNITKHPAAGYKQKEMKTDARF